MTGHLTYHRAGARSAGPVVEMFPCATDVTVDSTGAYAWACTSPSCPAGQDGYDTDGAAAADADGHAPLTLLDAAA